MSIQSITSVIIALIGPWTRAVDLLNDSCFIFLVNRSVHALPSDEMTEVPCSSGDSRHQMVGIKQRGYVRTGSRTTQCFKIYTVHICTNLFEGAFKYVCIKCQTAEKICGSTGYEGMNYYTGMIDAVENNAE